MSGKKFRVVVLEEQFRSQGCNGTADKITRVAGDDMSSNESFRRSDLHGIFQIRKAKLHGSLGVMMIGRDDGGPIKQLLAVTPSGRIGTIVAGDDEKQIGKRMPGNSSLMNAAAG